LTGWNSRCCGDATWGFRVSDLYQRGREREGERERERERKPSPSLVIADMD
jgi:hypothetical protein